MNLYINEEWYLCYNSTIYDNKVDENNKVLIWKPIWYEQVKFKIWEDWLFKQVK